MTAVIRNVETIEDMRLDDDAVHEYNTLLVLDSTGDSRFGWDPNNQTEVNMARQQFDSLREKGYLAYKVQDGGRSSETVHEFDRGIGELIMAPQTVGG